MTPDRFLAHLRSEHPVAAYLFLGSEPYRRDLCRKALVARVLAPEEQPEGLVRHDLTETTLEAVLDDARSMSLFAPRRIIWISNAEAALPRGRAATAADEGSGPVRASAASVAGYLKRPSPDAVLVFEASRFELDGEDKAKAERVRKFYSAVPAQVEFPHFTGQEARRLARELARAAGLVVGQTEIDLLAESLGNDAMRIAVEIEKLRLWAADGRKVTAEDLSVLVPDSSASTIFVLVDALARRDRLRAIGLLDTLVRQGEYLPLALSFLATLFRLALISKEKNLRSPQQVQDRFSAPGRPVWRSRAEQILHTASIFSREQLEAAIRSLYEADKALRDARPDDRLVLEHFILRLTG